MLHLEVFFNVCNLFYVNNIGSKKGSLNSFEQFVVVVVVTKELVSNFETKIDMNREFVQKEETAKKAEGVAKFP